MKIKTQPHSGQQQSHFSSVPKADIERSTFDRSHGHKTTFQEGNLIPVFVDEVLPGDTFNLSSTAFTRLATPLKPIMDNMYLDTHFFYVPYRLVWDKFPEFMGERKNPDDDNSALTIPQSVVALNPSTPSLGQVWHHMGVPPVPTGSSLMSISALPLRSYKLIWNEWFRDNNLQDRVPINTGDGPDVNTYDEHQVLPRGKRKDYFTSALPWPQAGDPVYIPLGQTATVVSNQKGIMLAPYGNPGDNHMMIMDQPLANIVYSAPSVNNPQTAVFGAETGLLADLTEATAVTINDLRTSFQIQRLLERDARGGMRYTELMLSHFGVHSDDLRLFRPEYLGGGTASININPIAQTVPVTDSPQANLAATGTGVGRGGFSKSFTEHGIIIGLVSVRADLTYQQGLERFWSRKTRYDFYWPALSHLGEQAILNKEIYLQSNNLLGTDGVTQINDETWGYQERYAEYRYKPSRITGVFQSTMPTSLDVWHLGQDFDALPALNDTFIREQPPVARIVAVPGEPHFLCDIWFKLSCTRPMPVYSVPGMIDHF